MHERQRAEAESKCIGVTAGLDTLHEAADLDLRTGRIGRSLLSQPASVYHQVIGALSFDGTVCVVAHRLNHATPPLVFRDLKGVPSP